MLINDLQGMYRTAQWIKSRIHTRRKGETAVQAVNESRANLTEQEETSHRGGNQILRTTMKKYWVCH